MVGARVATSEGQWRFAPPSARKSRTGADMERGRRGTQGTCAPQRGQGFILTEPQEWSVDCACAIPLAAWGSTRIEQGPWLRFDARRNRHRLDGPRVGEQRPAYVAL